MIIARPLVRLVLFTLVAVLALVGVTGAAASPPTTASGTFSESGFPTSVRTAGGNTILVFDTVEVYTGTFDGSSVKHGTLVIHADGSANYHGVETFTGTVNGTPGTVTLNIDAHRTSTQLFRATETILSGTGDLANLHGVLNLVGTVGDLGPLGTYSGQIH